MGGRFKSLLLLGVGLFLSLAVSIFAYNWLKGEAQKKKVVEVVKIVSPPAEVMKQKPPPSVGGIATTIELGKLAMAIKVNELSGVAGFIGPGDRVDVLVTIVKFPDPNTQPERISKVVLENISVLATDKETVPRKDKKKSHVVNVIILEVTPEEGEKLALAARIGDIQLALRNPLDSRHKVATRGAKLKTLIATRTGPKGISKPLIKKKVVELIVGEKISKYEFRYRVKESDRK